MNKRIISLVLTLAVMLGSIINLSSCSSAFSDWLKDYIQEDSGDNLPPSTGDNNDGSQNNPADSTPSTDGDNSTENENEEVDTPPVIFNGVYYPGQGSVAIEDISPKNRTLLSTVIIQSRFASSPKSGSGVIYELDKTTGDAYIITNYHIVYDKNNGICENITISLYGMTSRSDAIPATVVGGSVNYDISWRESIDADYEQRKNK